MSQDPFVIDINDPASYEQQVIQASFQQLVVVDFWAPWCQPCQILVPLLTKLAQEYAGGFTLAKVNSDENQELTMQVGIRNLPTVFFYKDGQVVDQFSGAISESEIKEKLDRLVSSPLSEALDAALSALELGHSEQSLNILKALNQEDPSNIQVLVAIANVYLQREELAECEEIVNALPNQSKNEEAVKSIVNQLNIAKNAANAPALDELKQQIKANPENYELRLQLATKLTAHQNYIEALDQLFDVIQNTKGDDFDNAKKQMLSVFELLGGQGDIVRRYRQKLFSYLN
ncbi:MAG: tetratricopeptide repeat protein [Gammaproteobacteria bacterium]|nr:tetratricopeptide repeat protein [Gammaproteobacteria bacterium]